MQHKEIQATSGNAGQQMDTFSDLILQSVVARGNES